MKTKDTEATKIGASKKTVVNKIGAMKKKTVVKRDSDKSSPSIELKKNTDAKQGLTEDANPKFETKGKENLSTPDGVARGTVSYVGFPAPKSAEKKPTPKSKSPAASKANPKKLEPNKPKPQESSKKIDGATSKKEVSKPAFKSDKVEETQESDDKDKVEGLQNAHDTKDSAHDAVKVERDEENEDTKTEDGHAYHEDAIDGLDEMVEYEEPEGFEEPGDDEGDVDEGDEAGEMEAEQEIEMKEVMKERQLKKEQEIFVGGLDKDAVEDDLKKAFEKIGEVVEVRLLKNHITNKNKGFAFVKFATKEQASRAVSELKNPVIRGKRCGVAPSEDNDTLFLGNICNTWTKEAIKKKLMEYGVDGVETITLVADPQHEGLSKGFAFVEFSCHMDAMNAYKRLQQPDVIFGHPERTAKVAFAEPLREPDQEVMAQVKSVFVDGLPPHWDEDRVREQMKYYGEIERVVLARNMPTAKRRDFGFVNFTTHDSAVACIEALNSTELVDGKNKVKTRARLANPLPKTPAVKGGMRGGFRIGSGMRSRFGRGFDYGRRAFYHTGYQRGRGFYPRGRGRGGRFSYSDDHMNTSFSEFHGQRGGGRGPSRGGHVAYHEEFGTQGPISRAGPDRPRRVSFDGVNDRPFPPRPEFPPQEDFDRTFSDRYYSDDFYAFDGMSHGRKRPYSSMGQDPGYSEPGSRSGLRGRYGYPDAAPSRTRYQDSMGAGSGFYSHDYYDTEKQFGRSPYSSLYRSDRSSGGSYYY
ncbi:heterogeneous nuclear ribonucleoprotein Q [Amborella trichopoda]|uniref:heterogeneous nuclear ribonucleoprotein Q n=1 Tax=Amborella trichopoda TaxID=13333 RepID=UPI0005D333D1|nr:heterogeneous nuclear ribonucleoprotein Q [Amborella trichopoda]|eukprot:XP_011622064.1 heterogeneous nuclear ribonucleoprotein Q [Amborella trichopoda]